MSPDDSLQELCIEGLKKRYKDNPKRLKDGKLSAEVVERLERELLVIKIQRLANDFLIAGDIACEMEERNIYRTARGSTVGSLVCYALNISHVCPLEFDLIFERFLNENRKETWPLEIDIDTDTSRRDEILDYIREKHGVDNVAPVVPKHNWEMKFYGTTSYEVKLGSSKMIFLVSHCLFLLAQTIDNIEHGDRKLKLNPYEFPLDDKKTFDLISRGDTKGIFQMESDGMRDLLQRLKPDCFRDIIAIIALYRPGPIESGMVDQYIDVKHGRKKAEYLHPVLEEVLGETYGVMVYQEQVMRILNRLGNTSLGDAYTCIKKIYKEEEKDEVEKYRQQFIEGGATYGVSKDESNSIFELIIEFAPYGFIKSHAVAFTLIAYMTAYLKTHYPTEYADAYDQGKPYIARLINT